MKTALQNNQQNIKCFDHNGKPLRVGDGIMCMANNQENEGVITALLPNNQIQIDGETGIITVNASDTFWLP